MVSVSQRALELNDKGERLRSEGNLEEALKAFSGAVLASPGYAAAWLNRADVLDKMGREDEAEADRQAVRSLAGAVQSYSLQQTQTEPTYHWTTPAPPRKLDGYDQNDMAGPGRYILNFFLAGFVGLLITFLLRNHGWLATWISLAIFAVGVIILVAEGPEALGLNFESSTR